VTIVIGTGLGIIGALGLQRWIASQLYGASAVDAEVFAGVSLLMIFVAVTATLGPARWAMKVDPMEALRHD
jgi:ABC-type antimicrobial peptide transport system permease subunit